MKPSQFLITVILSAIPLAVISQNKFFPPDPYTQWDGITHKSRYIISSPAYMGPNSLPVPLLHNGRVPDRFFWTGQYEYYYNTGDQTHDFYTMLVIPFAGSRIGFECKYVPVEVFSMDSTVSHLRRTISGKAVEGYSLGDFYFGTTIQLVRDHAYLPDLAFAAACRTASGTGRENSRHTDSPGYYFDLSIGDTYGKGTGFFESIRWYGEVGFYVWQTFLDNYPQNDALLFGLGLDLNFKYFSVDQSIRGYNGYMNNGDRPLVYRADLAIRIGSAGLVLGYERGIHDYPFESIRAGFEINGLK